MKSKILLLCVILCTISQANIYSQQKKKILKASPIKGNWETIHNPLEASTLRLEFKADRKFSYMLSSSWEGTYQLDGTKLISSTYIPIYKKYKSDTTTVLIYSDTVIQIGKDRGVDVTTTMVRKADSSNTGAGLIGTWIIKNQQAEYSTVVYSPAGKFNVKNILKSFHGNYIIKDDTLTAFSENRQMLKCRYVIDKGVMRLYSPVQSGPITLEKVDK